MAMLIAAAWCANSVGKRSEKSQSMQAKSMRIIHLDKNMDFKQFVLGQVLLCFRMVVHSCLFSAYSMLALASHAQQQSPSTFSHMRLQCRGHRLQRCMRSARWRSCPARLPRSSGPKMMRVQRGSEHACAVRTKALSLL
jgi:hypothetical protein